MRRRGLGIICPVQISQSFPSFLSRRCPGFYRLAPGENVDPAGGTCSYCSQEIVISALPPAPPHSPPAPTQVRRRGRPISKKPRTRRMSDTTKKKISESIKTFSICKLCSKQCRGFRGLVDHMHRDHENYKPWKCHICPESTAFVKTLYRHLKKEHGLSGGPCPVCGKIFTRAQSMLHHVNKVRRRCYIKMKYNMIDLIYSIILDIKSFIRIREDCSQTSLTSLIYILSSSTTQTARILSITTRTQKLISLETRPTSMLRGRTTTLTSLKTI